MSGDVNLQFIAFFSRFDRTQGPFIEEKSVDSLEIFPHLDPAAWLLPGKINAMKNLVH